MNLILFEKCHLIAPGRVRLHGAQARHVRGVLRAQVGDTLKVGELGGLKGLAQVNALYPESVELDVTLTESPPRPSPVMALIALPRPKAFRRILQTVVTLGIKDIGFFHAARVEKSYWQSDFVKPSAVREQLLLGLAQAGDTLLPDVFFRERFRPFFEDEGPRLLRGRSGYFAHPGAPGLAVPRESSAPRIVVIGPEGGFVPFEIELLQRVGFEPVGLGERILKTETAVTAFVSRIAVF